MDLSLLPQSPIPPEARSVLAGGAGAHDCAGLPVSRPELQAQLDERAAQLAAAHRALAEAQREAQRRETELQASDFTALAPPPPPPPPLSY